MDYVADNDLTVAWEWNEEKTAMMTAYAPLQASTRFCPSTRFPNTPAAACWQIRKRSAPSVLPA